MTQVTAQKLSTINNLAFFICGILAKKRIALDDEKSKQIYQLNTKCGSTTIPVPAISQPANYVKIGKYKFSQSSIKSGFTGDFLNLPSGNILLILA